MWYLLSVFLAGLFLASCAESGNSSHSRNTGTLIMKLWQPNDDTRDNFLQYHGMDSDTFESVRQDVIDIKLIIAKQFGHEVQTINGMDEFFDDILFTPEQARYLLRSLRNRRKRKVINFNRYPVNKWTQMPIIYKYDGTQSADDVKTIEKALAHWMNHTCLRFRRVDSETQVLGSHLLFTSTRSGCWSYMGRTQVMPQQINLQSPGCLRRLGVAVHEIGHALGFFHEHMRPGRDDFIQIVADNIIVGKEHNFKEVDSSIVDNMGVPYDYGSVMHYGSRDFAENTAFYTIKTTDPLHQLTPGQRVGLSDFDIKLTNMVYCEGKCKQLPCQNGGHTNPRNCSTCKCLDGFGGQYCQHAAAGKGGCRPVNSGVLRVPLDGENCVESPNHGTGSYDDFTSCNWILKAPLGCKINFYFKDDFRVYCSNEGYKPACAHWVEIKYKEDLTLRGPRFCCSRRPDFNGQEKLTSSGNEAVVVFKSDAETAWSGYRKGFKLCFKIADQQCLYSGANWRGFVEPAQPSTTRTVTPSATLTNATLTVRPTVTTSTTPITTTTAKAEEDCGNKKKSKCKKSKKAKKSNKSKKPKKSKH